MNFSPSHSDRLTSIYLTLLQYPILSERIHARMRLELFERGIITSQKFEAEVHTAALASQEREGLHDPFYEEPPEIWEVRQQRVRAHLTDLLFSQHLTFDLFEKLVAEVLKERGISRKEQMLSINPELAPIDLVFEQGMAIEHLPPEERIQYEARLQESKVVLIRALISDQLRYINIAKEWFTIEDLVEIRRRKIGSGRIGGKSAGMLLAYRVLSESSDITLRTCVRTPESYFIGADEMYNFMAMNNLVHWNDQKYKDEDAMRADYPLILEGFLQGELGPHILERLETLLVTVGKNPLIVRSSSLLEDNFGTSFAGKYESIFLPNQKSLPENLEALTQAIARVYGCTLNPNALLYRRSKGLQDYDERMAILIQVVEGERFGRYFLPQVAGVAFSRNLYRWAPQIRSEDGFIRMVWGLGTRAVDRVGNDYPRLIALSHPTLRPSNDPKIIRRYSQQFVDLIDLEDNQFKTLPIHDVLSSHYAPLRYLAQMDEDGYFASMRSAIIEGDSHRLTLTFDDLLQRTPFALQMREILADLEKSYHSPVDMEFTLQLSNVDTGTPSMCLTILQCRPQSHLVTTELVPIPKDLPREEIIFSTRFVVPQGYIDRTDLVLFVTPEGYFSLPTNESRVRMARTLGRLNAILKGKLFICVGPGRWGSSNSDLGVPIDYGDIYHTQALVELAGEGIGPAPEPSLGTHFFQDLLEAQIYPLAVQLDDPTTIFRRDFFYNTPNRIGDFIPVDAALQDSLRLIRVSDFSPNAFMRVVMDDANSLAVAYLVKDK